MATAGAVRRYDISMPDAPSPHPTLDALLADARAAGRAVLNELEGLAVLRRLGFDVPRHFAVSRHFAEADLGGLERLDLEALPGERVVVKAVSSTILHKSAVGGVATAGKTSAEIRAAIEEMSARLAEHDALGDVEGFAVFEYIEHHGGLGSELLLALRWTEDFGPVVAFGLGGVDAEALERALPPGRGLALLSPDLHGASGGRCGGPREILNDRLVIELAAGLFDAARLDLLLGLLLDRALDHAARLLPDPFLEIEINPLALTPRGPVALDAVVRLGAARAAAEPSRRAPEKLERLLRPRSIAVAGASSRGMNPGRRILRNVLAAGFPAQHVTVIKPGVDTLDGCRAVAAPADLEVPVDLLVVATPAELAARMVEETALGGRAASIILIPGGLGEKRGSEGVAEHLRGVLESLPDAPLVSGGNCLGIRSRPGRYDTLFIPPDKLPFPKLADGASTPLAVISASGAFAIARASQWDVLDPRYLITVGNQLDLTVGDFLEALADDPEIAVFAIYVEGFRPLDGRRVLRAAARIAESGRCLIVYRAGRTAAGARAAASHTAAMASDVALTRELLGGAGAVVAESLADFDDLVRVFCLLRDRPAAGRRLGAMSNAGFECVAIADHAGDLELAPLAPATRDRLAEILAASGLDGIVEPRNPLDVTPILTDAPFVDAARALLEDPGVDVGVIGCVPLTAALRTLPEELAEGSLVEGLAELRREIAKPWVAVVDSGPLYDAMAHRLTAAGVPTFRTAERALRALGVFCRRHQKRD